MVEVLPMPKNDRRSLNEIQRDTERTRAGLVDTIGQLQSKITDTADEFRERVSPDSIKEEVSEFFSSRGDHLVQSIKERARENPLQAIAIGATIAYPLFRMVRSVPIPVLMVGAGLYLAGSKRGQKLTRDMTNAARDAASTVADTAAQAHQSVQSSLASATDLAGKAADSVSDFVDNARDKTSAVRDRAYTNVDDVRRKATATAGALAGEFKSASERVASAFGAAGDSMQDTASQVRSQVSAGVNATAEMVTETARKVGHQASRASESSAQALVDAFQKNPLLVGGIGLAIGALIAASLPTSRAESGAMGAASQALKRQALDAGGQGVAYVKQMGAGIATDVSEAAVREGISPSDVTGAVRDVGRRVRQVTENAVTTAFELPAEKTS